MSALGQKQTFRSVRPMSALPLRADIQSRIRDVRFVPLKEVEELYPIGLSDCTVRSSDTTSATLLHILGKDASLKKIQSTLMLAKVITFAHLSAALAISAPN